MKRGPDRITIDASDRLKIKEALQNYMDTLAIDTNSLGLLNVITCLHATDNVNADEIERENYGRILILMDNKLQQDTEQECGIADFKKNIKLDGKSVYDTEMIYTRVICLQQYRDNDITYVLSRLGTFPSASIII